LSLLGDTHLKGDGINLKHEFTKYYCDCCREEIQDEEFSKVFMKITFRSKDGGCQQEIHETKDVCDKCMLEAGFTECEVESYKLSKQQNNLRYFFLRVFKKIFKREEL